MRRQWAAAAACRRCVGTWRFDVIETGIYYYCLLFLFEVRCGHSAGLFIVEIPLMLPNVYSFIIKCLKNRPQISLNLMNTAVLNSFLKFYVMISTQIDL